MSLKHVPLPKFGLRWHRLIAAVLELDDPLSNGQGGWIFTNILGCVRLEGIEPS